MKETLKTIYGVLVIASYIYICIAMGLSVHSRIKQNNLTEQAVHQMKINNMLNERLIQLKEQK